MLDFKRKFILEEEAATKKKEEELRAKGIKVEKGGDALQEQKDEDIVVWLKQLKFLMFVGVFVHSLQINDSPQYTMQNNINGDNNIIRNNKPRKRKKTIKITVIIFCKPPFKSVFCSVLAQKFSKELLICINICVLLSI